jgi:hypothetical protein
MQAPCNDPGTLCFKITALSLIALFLMMMLPIDEWPAGPMRPSFAVEQSEISHYYSEKWITQNPRAFVIARRHRF